MPARDHDGQPLPPARLERVDDHTVRIPGGRGEAVELMAADGCVAVTVTGAPVLLDEAGVRGLCVAVAALRSQVTEWAPEGTTAEPDGDA